MILTIYHKDGRKERRTVGYGGDLCHQASAPYEKRERGMKKTLTPEAFRDPVEVVSAEEAQQAKVR